MLKKRKIINDFFNSRSALSCSAQKLVSSPWACTACTFVNHKRQEACELCLSKRASPFSSSQAKCLSTARSQREESQREESQREESQREESQTESQGEESQTESQREESQREESQTESQREESQTESEMEEAQSQKGSVDVLDKSQETTVAWQAQVTNQPSKSMFLSSTSSYVSSSSYSSHRSSSSPNTSSFFQAKTSSQNLFTPKSKGVVMPSLLCAQDPSLLSTISSKSAFSFLSSTPSAANKTRSSIELLRSPASANLLGPSAWTQLLHRLDQAMVTTKPQTANEWLDAVRSVCGHSCPTVSLNHQWGALVPSFRPTLSNVTKRSAPYCTGYIPVLQEDRPPGCGDSLYIDCVRRSHWSHPARQSDEYEVEKSFQVKNTLFILRAVANSGILSPIECKTVHYFLNDLPFEAQQLYATLFPHRGPWFRLDGYGVRTRVSASSSEFVPLLHNSSWIHALGSQDLLFEPACKTPRAFDDEQSEQVEEGVSVCDVAFLLTLLTVKDLKDLEDYNSRRLVSSTIKVLGPKAAALHQTLQRILGVRNTLTKTFPKSGTLNSVWSKLGVCFRLKRTKLVQHAIRMFMLSAGYLPEEAVNVLLHIDLSTQTFASPTSSLRVSSNSLLIKLEQMVLLNGALEAAVVWGDEDNAYVALQEAANALNDLNLEGTGRMSVGWMAARTILKGTALLEREKRFLDAIHYFRLVLSCSDAEVGAWHRAQAYLRFVLDLEKIGEKYEALRICERALSESCVQGSVRVGLARICLRLSVLPRRLKVPSTVTLLEAPERYLTGKRPERGVWITDQGAVCHGVEAYVLACYQREGWAGCHAENSLWLTLINLLAFDILCPNRDGDGQQCEFHSPYQDHPLSLWGGHMVCLSGCRSLVSSFYATRPLEIEARLQELNEGKAAEILARAWICYPRQTLFVNWNRHSLQQLQGICNGVGSEVLVKLVGAAFKTHLFEAVCCGGFPDLSLWKPGSVKFVEVKGPGDALSDKQRGLMHLLLEAKADVEVCYVRESA